jgi:hypothetical protein
MYFDTLMDGKFNQKEGEYQIEVMQVAQQSPSKTTPGDLESGMNESALEQAEKASDTLKMESHIEPRSFLFCNMLHHPGLATINH